MYKTVHVKTLAINLLYVVWACTITEKTLFFLVLWELNYKTNSAISRVMYKSNVTIFNIQSMHNFVLLMILQWQGADKILKLNDHIKSQSKQKWSWITHLKCKIPTQLFAIPFQYSGLIAMMANWYMLQNNFALFLQYIAELSSITFESSCFLIQQVKHLSQNYGITRGFQDKIKVLKQIQLQSQLTLLP